MTSIERVIQNPARARGILRRVAWVSFSAAAAIVVASGPLQDHLAAGLPSPDEAPLLAMKRPTGTCSDEDLDVIWTVRWGAPKPEPTVPEPAAPAPAEPPQVDLVQLLSDWRLVACAPHSDRESSSCIFFDRQRGRQTPFFVGDQLGETGLRLADVGRGFIILEKDGRAIEVRLKSQREQMAAMIGQPVSPWTPREPLFTREEVVAFFRSREWRNKEPFGIQAADPGQNDGSPFERWLSLSPGSVILLINGDPVCSSSSLVAALNQSRPREHQLVLRDTSGKQTMVFKTREK